MISKDEKQRLRGIISETITLLCKSRLFEKFKEEFYIEGLIGITLDQEELMIVSIHEKICNDIKEDTTTPVKKDHPVVEDAGNHSAKKRKTPHENGPKEKTPKVEKESDKPLAQVPSVISTNMKSDSYNISQPPQFTPDLQSPYLPTSQNPSHLERLKNFYMLSAGYGNVLNLNAGTALTCLGSNNNTPTGALNLAIDANRSSPVSKSSARRKSKAINQQQSDKVITKIKEEDQTDIKTENSSQPPALTVKPLPLTSFPMYNPPARKQHQAVFSEPLLVPQVKSPTVMQTAIQSPQKDSKLSDILDKIKNNIDGRDDGSPRRSVFDHIAHNIVHTEGKFITSRMIGRKTGRKAVAIREVFLRLTTPVNDVNHIGQAKEISRGTLVYYKCPPSIIKEEALAKYGIDFQTYKFLYSSEMKTPPSQHMMTVVEGHSPYVSGHMHADVEAFETPPKLIDANQRPNLLGKQDSTHFGNGTERMSGLNSDVLFSHREDDKRMLDQDESDAVKDAEVRTGKRVGLSDNYANSNGLLKDNSYTETNGVRDEECLDHLSRYEDDPDSPGSDRLLMDVGLPVEGDGGDEREFDELVKSEDELECVEDEEDDKEVVSNGTGENFSVQKELCHVQKGVFEDLTEATPLEGLEKLVSERSAFI